ncbi:MAG: NUDIX hydrolase [Micrococcales bacterium]|nr:NUDIX hydrolase [Micrococcales bacterium]
MKDRAKAFVGALTAGANLGADADLGLDGEGVHNPGAEGVHDLPVSHPVRDSETVFAGRIWDIVADVVALPSGQEVRREYMRHPGAAAVIALNAAGQVLLQRQYRHPVRAELFEPPAGLLDEVGEPVIEAAKRELAEEADLMAGDWRHLLTFNSTPGGTDEVIHVFLARDLAEVPAAERHERVDEEADLVPVWLDLDQACALVMSGALRSPTAVVGLLAAVRARDTAGFDALPPS